MNERTARALDRFLATDPYEYGPQDAADLPAEPDADAQNAAATNEQETERLYIIRLCQQIDQNGEYLDRDQIREHRLPLTLEEARAALRRLLAD